MKKLSKKYLEFRLREAKAYIFNFYNRPPAVRAVIFAQGRTGSTLLESLLSSTGSIRKHGELLSCRKGEILFPVHFIRGLSNWHSRDNFVFHLKIYHLQDDRKHPVPVARFLETLQHEGWKVIYLRRENKLKHVMSGIIAGQRGAINKFDNIVENIKIDLDCKKFTRDVRGRYDYTASELESLSNVDYHEVIYENDLENPGFHQETINRIFDYLSLEHKAASTTHKKINTYLFKDLITNYDEFVGCVIENGWEQFLE